MVIRMVTALTVRGIGEPHRRQNNTATRAAHLMGTVSRVDDVPWAATYGPFGGPQDSPSFQVAVDEAIRMVDECVADADGPVVVIGFSGGATVAGHYVRRVHDGRLDRRGLVAAGLIADPHMPKYVQGRDPHGDPAWGVAGSRDTGDTVPVRWAWSAGDPIPCTPRLDPLRTIADQTAAMALGDPSAWTNDLLDRLRRGRWQPSAIDWRDPLGTLRRYKRAIEAAARYLGGDHVVPYQEGHIPETLAAQLDEIVEASQ